MVCKYFDKETGLGASVNQELAEQLHKPAIKKFKISKVCAGFNDTIWAAYLAEMKSLTSFNRGFNYLSCVVDVFTKYAWVKALEDKKAKTVLHGFIEIVNESKRKQMFLWI